MTPPGQTRTPWHLTGTVMAVALAVMNVATYGFTVIAARLLGPGAYGAFAAVMGLMLVLGVLQLGLQTTGARRVAAEPDSVAEVERSLLRVAAMAGLGLAVVMLVLSPLIDRLLNLDSLPTALLVAAAVFPMTMFGAQAGILQGERRWRPLAAVYIAGGVPRLVVGTGLLLVRPTETMAMLAVAVTFWAPVAIGWFALRRSSDQRVHVPTSDHGTRSILREAGRNSQSLLAFFAISNVDIIIARDVLDAHEAGLYAGGLILVKAVLFLPQFVVIVAFPSLSEESERHRAMMRSLGLTLGLGIVSVAGASVLSGLALVFVGGPQYSEIQGDLWLFAILGTALAMLQLLVYSLVARQGWRSVYVIWAGLAALVLLSRGADSVVGLATIVVAVDAAVLAVLLLLALRPTRATPRDAGSPASGGAWRKAARSAG